MLDSMMRRPRVRGWWLGIVLGIGLCGGGAVNAQQEAVLPPPQSVWEWLAREHRLLHRYLAVVRQAAHDYRYKYQTPVLLMPIAMELFTGYVAPFHAMESEFLYPAIRSSLTAEEQAQLDLIDMDQHSESHTVQQWQEQLAHHQAGTPFEQEAQTIDYLAQLINRHLVLQENRLFPALERLSAEEQAAILGQVAAYAQDAFGDDGRKRYEQLMDYIEEQISLVAKRIW